MWLLVKTLVFSIILVVVFTTGFSSCYSQNNSNYNTDSNVPITQQPSSYENSLDFKIGQMLIVGFRGMSVRDQGVQDIIRDIQHFNLGGVILFDYDIAMKSPRRNIKSRNQLKQLIKALQSANAASTTIPLFISIDQEGGNIQRLKKKFGFSSTGRFSAQYLGTQGPEQTKIQSRRIANTLTEVGINLNFAPVVDLNINPDNQIIGKLGRSFSDDPKLVTDHALAFIGEHNLNKIICVLKHFPGHGSSYHDSHLGWVDVTDSWDESELKPYRSLINADLGFQNAIMIGHIFNGILDPKYPATLSKKIITGELRTDMKYTGVVISDDMQMKAISHHYDWNEAIYRTIEAGVDIILIGNNSEYERNVVKNTVAIIKRLIQTKQISETRIEESYQRIKRLKSKLLPIINNVSQVKYKLTVNVVPFGSRIRIMNILPKYFSGIRLPPGRYRLRVEKPGYFTHNELVTIQKQDITISLELRKK